MTIRFPVTNRLENIQKKNNANLEISAIWVRYSSAISVDNQNLCIVSSETRPSADDICTVVVLVIVVVSLLVTSGKEHSNRCKHK